jgi:pimeloyl-ACP methyl ester carboxylesterase
VLLGHSMGGPVALAAAAHAPERVAGLALIASVGLRPHRLIRQFPVAGAPRPRQCRTAPRRARVSAARRPRRPWRGACACRSRRGPRT